MLIVYSYDEDGVYLGKTQADESPLEPGKYLIPANATETPPPGEKECYAIVFTGTVWEYAEDHRGETRYSTAAETLGMQVEVINVGSLDKVAPDTTDKEAPDVPLGHRLTWMDAEWALEPPDPADAIRLRIAEIESAVTPRRIREAVLGTDDAWLAKRNAEIKALRGKL